MMDYIFQEFQSISGTPFFSAAVLKGILLIFILSAIIQLFYYFFFYLRIFLKDNVQEHHNKPSISVIIAARNEANNLQKYLPRILQQEYPDFEVIVVNDASEDESAEVLENFKRENSHFYYTNIPYDKYFTHGKKLALLVGHKAAKKEWIVYTDADCYPASNQWLNELSKGMDKEAEIVLGFGAHLKRRGFFNKMLRYDTISIALQYLSFARAKIPYMGVGRNLAIKKTAIDKLKNYKEHSHILSGADDLIVNELANKKNTRIITQPNSFTFSVPQVNFSRWILQKSRHLSSSGYYKFKHKLLLFFEPFSRSLFYLGLIILAWSKVFPLIILSIFILRFLVQNIIGAKLSFKFKSKDLLMVWFLFDTFVFVIIGLISAINIFSRKKIRWK